MPDPETIAKGLLDALDERAPRLANYIAYYRGVHRIRYSTDKWDETFRGMFSELSDNWSQIVVDSAVERLKVEGFRFGPEDDAADEEAWALWQANYLDADSIVAHTQACMTGIAYVLVTPGDDPETPRISVESPLQVIALNDPRDRRRRIAALKTWVDEEEYGRAVLYLPESFHTFARAKGRKTWLADGASVANPIGIVPVIPMLNNPDVFGFGMSDLQVMLSQQDAINKLLADLLINSEYIAFPQRWATGIAIPDDPATGRPMDPNTYSQRFLSSTARVWASTSPNTQFGSLPESDGAGYVRQIEMLIQHIAAVTRTPPHYLTAGLGQWPSGDSLRASEAGLVAKVRRKQTTYGETWEEAMRLAFAYRGDDARASASQAETIWSDPEFQSQGVLADALLKMSTLGVPLEALFERWGVSPQEIARWKASGEFPEALPRATPPPEQLPSAPTEGAIGG